MNQNLGSEYGSCELIHPKIENCIGDDPSNSSFENKSEKGLEVKRRVGLFSGVALIIGGMIGTGIFVTPGEVLMHSGSPGLSFIIWVVCGLISIIGALAYMELGTMMPKTGGDYSYFMDGLKSLHPFWGPLPAFLYSWINILILNPLYSATGCLTIAKYSVHPLWIVLNLCDHDGSKDVVTKLVAIFCLMSITILNCYSVDWLLRIANFMTISKLFAIFILICVGFYQLSQGKTEYLARGFEGSTTDPGTIALACYGGLWSYSGWKGLVIVMEELKDPLVNLPRAMLIAIPIVIVFYVLVNVAYLTVLSPEELIQSEAVAVDMANRLLGPMAFVIPMGVVFSAFGAQMGGMFSSGRLFFASAREGHLLSVLSYIHVESRTPNPAFFLTMLMGTVAILAEDITFLINFSTFTEWAFYILVMILLLVLRRIQRNTPRPYRVSLVIPIAIMILGSYFVVAPFISNPAEQKNVYYILATMGVGLLFYIPFVYYKYAFGFIAPLTRIIQLSLNVGPPAKPVLHTN